MSAEENKAIARRWTKEIWEKGDLAVVDEIVSPTFVADGSPMSLEDLKQSISNLRAQFSDLHIEVEEQIAEGDKVVNRIFGQGIYLGGASDIPDSSIGKQMKTPQIDIFRIVNSKIEEVRPLAKTMES